MGMEKMKNQKKNKLTSKSKDEEKFNEKIFITLLLIVYLIFLLVIDSLSPSFVWDENVYLGNARSYISHSNFIEDFRFPGMEYLVAFFWLFTGESILVAKLIVILMSVLTILFTYLCAKRFMDKRLAYLASFLFALAPLMLQWGFRILGEAPGLFFVMLSFYMIILAKEKNKLIYIALAAIFSAYAFLSRFALLIFPFCIVIYFLLQKKSRHLLFFSIFFILALSPWLYYNTVTYNNPVWDVLEYNKVVKEWTFLEPIPQQLYNLLVNLRVLLPFAIIGTVSFILSKEKKSLKFLIVFYVLVSLAYYLFFVKMKADRYFLAFLPFLYILGFEGLAFINSKLANLKPGRFNWKKIFFAFLLVLIILDAVSGSIYTLEVIIKKETCDSYDGAIFKSIDYMKPKINEHNAIVSNYWPYFGYFLNAKSYTAWTSPRNLIENYSVNYFIYGDWAGNFYNLTYFESQPNIELEKVINGSCNWTVRVYHVTNATN
jgi:4-amino-4-deoxy-L-arabinose transferase-like glycosyltransferase